MGPSSWLPAQPAELLYPAPLLFIIQNIMSIFRRIYTWSALSLGCCMAAVLLYGTPSVQAEDSVLSTIKEAMKQYEKGDYTAAASNLNYASQLVLQKKSEQMKTILPDAPPGWLAEEASSQTIGAEVLGGGITISRVYTKDEARVQMDIMTDSPVLQSVLMMTSNAVFAGAGGGKLETVKGNKAIVKYDDDSQNGEIYIAANSRFVVLIKGRHVSREEMILFANILDYSKLAKN